MKIDFSQAVIHTKDKSIFEKEPVARYFVPVKRRVALLLRCIYAIGYTNSPTYRDVYGFESRHKPFYYGTGEIIMDRATLEYEQAQAVEKLSTNKFYLYKIAKQCEKDANKLLCFSVSLSLKLNTWRCIISPYEKTKIPPHNKNRTAGNSYSIGQRS